MSTNYIEIDSTYRNRNQFPLPSEFDVLISQSGLKGKSDAVDPICDSAPIYVFNISMSNVQTAVLLTEMKVVSPSSVPLIQSPTEPGSILLKTSTPIAILRTEKDFYVGCSLCIYTFVFVGTNRDYRRVTAYEYAGMDSAGDSYGIFTFANPFPTTVFYSADIINPTPLVTNSTVPVDSTPRFWIPKGTTINNYYVNYYVFEMIRKEYKKIIAYDGLTRYATLESPTSTNWFNGSAFCIRKELPILSGVAFFGPGTVEIDTFSVAVNLIGTASSVKNFYVGDYIYFGYGLKDLAPNQMNYPPFNQYRRITAYDEVTKIVTFYPPILVTQDALSASSNPFIIPFPPFTIYVLYYEILPFSRDNFSPFNYIGSIVSSQQQVCYEIELRNIVIPNFVLKSGRGGRIVFYPYIYVEFFPISDSSTNPRAVMCSNNPNSYKMLFRAIVSDTQQQEFSPFIKLGGDGQVKTIKFKPNDSFHFAVYNSDGELLQFSQSDNYSPISPNPLVQISAMFTIRRVA
jgi:hypothetical protein